MADPACPACPACNVPWRNHAGPISLCEALAEALAEARADLAASRATNASLHRRVQQAESRREALAIAAGPHAHDLRFAAEAWWALGSKIAPYPTPISELPVRALAVLAEVEQLRAEVARLRAQGEVQ